MLAATSDNSNSSNHSNSISNNSHNTDFNKNRSNKLLRAQGSNKRVWADRVLLRVGMSMLGFRV